MTDRNETATYLYCLVRQDRAPVLARAPRGLPATGRARALDAGDGLWLVVADAPLSRYGSAPLETHLRDLEWVAACATAHEAVVEFAARGATTVPLKLFTLFNGDERAVAHIRRLRPTIDRVLDRVAGRQEWGVRVRLDEVAARRRHVERARRVTAGVSSGTRCSSTGRSVVRSWYQYARPTRFQFDHDLVRNRFDSARCELRD